MKKIYLALLLFVLALGVFVFVRLSVTNGFDDDGFGDDESDDIFGDDDGGFGGNVALSKNVSQIVSGKISLALLSKHDSVNDCWVAYNGKVYDISSYLPRHPGSSAAIAPSCGTADEFKNAFEGKHGTNKVSSLMNVGVLIGDFDVIGEI